MKKQCRQDLGLCGHSLVRYWTYSKKCFAQIYRALYGEAKEKQFFS